MRLTKTKRGRVGAKRIDLSDLRHVLRDGRQWAEIGLVVAPTDGSPYWRIETDDDGTEVDILVELVLQPSQLQVTARLASGIWTVPALGEECAVLIPAGRVDFMPIIVAILSSNAVPGGGQGPAPNTIVIARGQVLIHDGAGGAEALVKKSEFVGHTHGPGTFVAGSNAVTGASGGADDVTGTTVLQAK